MLISHLAFSNTHQIFIWDMGKHRYIKCEICSKSIRSDWIKKHNHNNKMRKYPTKNCVICKKTIIAKNLSRHIKTHDLKSKEIMTDIQKSQNKFDEMKETGSLIKKMLEKQDFDVEAIPKDYVEILKIKTNASSCKTLLRPWQQQLMEVLVPSDREVIWVVGKDGNEGKSWFQKYLKNHYGSVRTFSSSIGNSSNGVLHTLSKQLLSLIDVFIFNIPRCFSVTNVPFSLLENLKDGEAISLKYDSKTLSFKTPNIVIIFSNKWPDRMKISRDRWKIFNIKQNELIEDSINQKNKTIKDKGI